MHDPLYLIYFHNQALEYAGRKSCTRNNFSIIREHSLQGRMLQQPYIPRHQSRRSKAEYLPERKIPWQMASTAQWEEGNKNCFASCRQSDPLEIPRMCATYSQAVRFSLPSLRFRQSSPFPRYRTDIHLFVGNNGCCFSLSWLRRKVKFFAILKVSMPASSATAPIPGRKRFNYR